MKLTNKRLKRIIKEEIAKVLKEKYDRGQQGRCKRIADYFAKFQPTSRGEQLAFDVARAVYRKNAKGAIGSLNIIIEENPNKMTTWQKRNKAIPFWRLILFIWQHVMMAHTDSCEGPTGPGEFSQIVRTRTDDAASKLYQSLMLPGAQAKWDKDYGQRTKSPVPP
mgnify:CR=1 FL=1|jgi:hypothetical protein